MNREISRLRVKQITVQDGGWASPNKLKALMEQRLGSLKEEGTLPLDCLWTHTASTPWVSSPLASLQIVRLHDRMSQ